MFFILRDFLPVLSRWVRAVVTLQVLLMTPVMMVGCLASLNVSRISHDRASVSSRPRKTNHISRYISQPMNFSKAWKEAPKALTEPLKEYSQKELAQQEMDRIIDAIREIEKSNTVRSHLFEKL